MKSMFLKLTTLAMGLTAFMLPIQSMGQQVAYSKQKAEACFVEVSVYQGYTFHKAKYPDGTAVVTCLDGDMKGVQGITYNGDCSQSSAVEWYQDHFVHHYEYGNVYSYPDRQVLEITVAH